MDYVQRTRKCWKMTQHWGWQPYKDPIAGDCGHKAVSVLGGLYLACPGSSGNTTVNDDDEYKDQIKIMRCSKSTSGRKEMLRPNTQKGWEKQEMANTSIGRNGCAVKVSGDTFLTLGGKTGPNSYSTVVVAHNIVHQARRNVTVMPHSLSKMGCVYFQKDSERFIILPGELNFRTGECKVTLDGKAFV